MTTFHNPVAVHTGDLVDTLARIASHERRSLKLVVASKRFMGTDDFAGVMNTLGKDCSVFSDIENGPSIRSCQSAIDTALEVAPDFIVAIGGGSVLDTAKVMRVALYRGESQIEELLGNLKPVAIGPKARFVAVPTTHGTGSEMTKWATVWDKNDKRKHSISDPDNYPDDAIYDVRLCESLPVELSLASAMDALSHALEAIWNKNENERSDEIAIRGIGLIVPALDGLSEPVDLDVRRQLLLGSHLAGLAFSNTSTAAAHSISYPLTAHFGIPHGIACSMPLRPLMEINGRSVRSKLDRLSNHLGVAAADELWPWVERALAGKVRFCLREYGVARSDLGWIKDECFTKGRMDNNIVDLDSDDIMTILNAIF